MNSAAQRTARVVRAVTAQAVHDAASSGVVVLDDWTPEGELAYEWLVEALGEDRVWRAASLTPRLHGPGDDGDAQRISAWRMAREHGVLIAHPANKTALLLGGRLPWADVLPLGDVWASQVEAIAGQWSAAAEVEAVAAAAGGVVALDAALMRFIDAREMAGAALASLPAVAAQQVMTLYERGRHYRLHARVVPKLAARTIGNDLFD